MARKTVFVSDQSGAMLDGSAWTVKILGPKNEYHSADLTAEEAGQLIIDTGARARAKRGRKKAAA